MRAYYENHITEIQVFLELLFPTKISLLSIQFVELCRNSKKLARFVDATRTYQRSAGSSENIADVRNSVEENPNLSISRRS